MKVYDAPNIRNVAVVGHGGCGKTSLVSAMLFDMGAVNRLGRVDDGTTVTDFDPDEVDRKISLQCALAYGEWKKSKINLIDAPGYANFLSEARAALRVADAALVAGAAFRSSPYREGVGVRGGLGIPPSLGDRMDRERAPFCWLSNSLQRASAAGWFPLPSPSARRRLRGFVEPGALGSVYEGPGGKLYPGRARRRPAGRLALEPREMVAESTVGIMSLLQQGSWPPTSSRGLRQR